MNAGTLCLAGDSLIRDLRILNLQVLRLQHYVDFGDAMPDVNALRDTLAVLKNRLKLLLDCATDKSIDLVDNLISPPIRKELAFMLEAYASNNVPDYDFTYLKLCVHMLKHLKYLQLKYYLNYVSVYDNDHVKTFTHVLDIFVPPTHELYDHIVYELRSMLALCDQIAERLSSF
ncbi:ORF-129 [Agrotis segetum nucleopolyhedrovirus A]|uniref:ORF-129 n=1 Tax=Agrotis segetum nuclear polyhedrosis virus TaxID=1962501 RepID=Q287E3_NPVAS|nr:ORF-129 [Agrotis segetum nucleopolyhedrovirus A]AAZ38295.1 ORF-129 [Agrotis segetum nucleopolyhedrovirus A]